MANKHVTPGSNPPPMKGNLTPNKGHMSHNGHVNPAACDPSKAMCPGGKK